MSPTRRDILRTVAGVAAAGVLAPIAANAAVIHPEPLPIGNISESAMTGREWAESYRDAILQLRPDAVIEIESSGRFDALVTSDQHDMSVLFTSGAGGGSAILMVSKQPLNELGMKMAAFSLASACFGEAS